MNNGSFHQSPVANHLLQLQHLLPAIAYGPAPEAGTRAMEGKRMIPAITYGPEPEQGSQAAKTSPEREVIPVDGKEAEIMQMAESIERECFREAKSACKEGMHPAIYYGLLHLLI